MKQARLMSFQAQTDVTQRCTGRELSEQQMQELVVTRQIMRTIVAFILLDQLAEGRHLYQIGYLCENVLARIHFLQIVRSVRNGRISNQFCQRTL
jgi:hypothetical protein